MRALVILSLLPVCYAQSHVPAKTELTGFVLDSHRVPVPGVKVFVEGVTQKDVATAETDGAGVYRLLVNSGSYKLHAQKDGKGEASAGPFTVTSEKIHIDLTLRAASSADQAQFFDEPQFTVAGVTDNTYLGGHGSDTVLRSSETLTQATASLGQHPRDPSSADPHHARAEMEEKSGHPLEAIKEFQRAAELDPSEPNLFDWGVEFLVHRTPQPAIDVFTKGVQQYPQSARMLLALGSARYAAGAYDQAAECFFKATDLRPEDPVPYIFLTNIKANEITHSAAFEQRLERFAKLQPGNALANYAYAVSLWDRRAEPGDPDRALKSRARLQKVIALDPRFGAAFVQLGILEAVEQKYASAIRDYQEAIAVQPELEEAHYRLAEAYRITGDRVKADQEMAVYDRLSKQSAAKVEQERRTIQRLVVDLRGQEPAPASSPAKPQ